MAHWDRRELNRLIAEHPDKYKKKFPDPITSMIPEDASAENKFATERYVSEHGGSPDAVKYTEQALTAEQKAQALANIGAASEEEVAALADQKYEGPYATDGDLPAASASTMGAIYLVGPDANDEYERKVTKLSGSTYSWSSLGKTSIDLANYATKEEVTELEAKVDDLSTGKYYGYFAQEEDLPEADVDGFAYVGEGPTYTIYNLRGGVWTSSGITVNQSPIGNEEDINQNEDGKLQFANRNYNAQQPNGMGYKILRKDATFASQVTDTNTIYEIRYPFDLNNATVPIPSGSILKFDGGKLANGTLSGDFLVNAERTLVFDDVTIPKINGEVFPEWFGAFPDGSTDCTAEMQKALNAATTVRLGIGTYVCSAALELPRNANLMGESDFDSVLKCNGLRPKSLNVISGLCLVPYNASTAYLIDINSAYINRSYTCISIIDVIFDAKTGFESTSFLRIKCDSTRNAYSGMYGITVSNVRHITGRIKDLIVFEADTSNSNHAPWLTSSFFKDMFSSGCKNVLNCVVDNPSYAGSIFMSCLFDNVSAQFNPGYSERFATLSHISSTVFKSCGCYDSGSVKPYYLQNDKVLVGITDNIEKSVEALFDSASSIPIEKILLDNTIEVGGMTSSAYRGPIRMQSLANANYDISGGSPTRPGIFPSYWYTDGESNFRGFRISNYTTLGSTRNDVLLGVNSAGYPVCSLNKSGADAFDTRLIYSDAYVPRAAAASMPTTKKVLGSMLYQTSALIPVWWQPSALGWFNSDGIKINANVTAIKGNTATREALQLNADNIGLRFFDTSLLKYVLWKNGRWTNIDGTSLQDSGTTAQRPTRDNPVGFCYFDTDLGKPIWVKEINGGVTTWVDATGATV